MKKKLVSAGLVATASFGMIYLVNKVHFFISTSRDLMKYSGNEFYDWRFGRIRYNRTGQGSPLLFIHDLTPGSSSYEYHRLINNLTDEHEIYTLDLLGYGLSDKPSMTYTNQLYEQLVSDFIQHVIRKKTSVVATGHAVPFTVMACHDNPEFFDKMIFINPQSLHSQNHIPSRQMRILKFLFEVPVIGTFLYNILVNKFTIRKAFRKEYFYDRNLIKDKYIAYYAESAQTQGYRAKYPFASYVSRFTNTNIIRALKEINHSVLLIGGREEDEIEGTLEDYLYYNNALEIEYLSETRHLPQLEAPDQVLEKIRWFL